MPSELASRTKPVYLEFVFGVLSPDARSRALSTIERAEQQLFALRDALNEQGQRPWECPGIRVVTYGPPEAFLSGVVESDELGFCVELTPDYRRSKKQWRPWDGPQAIEGWDISAEIHRLDIDAPDYDHQSENGPVLGMLPARREHDLEHAGDALVEVCAQLRALGLSRPATLATWRAHTNR